MPINPSPAVARACDMLLLLTRHPTESFSVSVLAKELGIPRATCDAVLLALADARFVTRSSVDLRYQLGPSCITVGDGARMANPTLQTTADEAEHLARALAACTAVSIREAEQSRVAEVFDFGPPFGSRAQVGQSIPHTPPLGAVYVAWDPGDAEAWIKRGGAELKPAEQDRYRAALQAVRTRGYSVTVASPRRPDLERALTTLVDQPDAEHARRQRDQVMAELLHSEWLAADVKPQAPLRISHMSAPVFDLNGRAVGSILLLGPEYEISPDELRTRGEQLVGAAVRATRAAGGRTPSAHDQVPGTSQ